MSLLLLTKARRRSAREHLTARLEQKQSLYLALNSRLLKCVYLGRNTDKTSPNQRKITLTQKSKWLPHAIRMLLACFHSPLCKAINGSVTAEWLGHPAPSFSASNTLPAFSGFLPPYPFTGYADRCFINYNPLTLGSAFVGSRERAHHVIIDTIRSTIQGVFHKTLAQQTKNFQNILESLDVEDRNNLTWDIQEKIN